MQVSYARLWCVYKDRDLGDMTSAHGDDQDAVCQIRLLNGSSWGSRVMAEFAVHSAVATAGILGVIFGTFCWARTVLHLLGDISSYL